MGEHDGGRSRARDDDVCGVEARARGEEHILVEEPETGRGVACPRHAVAYSVGMGVRIAAWNSIGPPFSRSGSVTIELRKSAPHLR